MAVNGEMRIICYLDGDGIDPKLTYMDRQSVKAQG